MHATGYRRGEAFEIELEPIDDKGERYLAAPAAAAFRAMAEVAKLDGVTLKVNTAFRTHQHQTRLWVAYQAAVQRNKRMPADMQIKPPPPVARPGYSNHQAGTAVDIETEQGTNAAYKWLETNAGRFGFKRTVASEPWHWEHA
jgi:LAS superfamily LD-carboxypeptidase LdcB